MDNNDLEQLKIKNIQLKSEQKQLLNQLENLNKKLEESDAFKSHFLSNISNEIINPFTSILGIAQNIQLLEKEDIAQIHSMSNIIYNEAFDLDFQLRNIFAAANIESGQNKLELAKLRVVDFVNEIIESLRLKAEKNALYFEFTHFIKQDYFITDADKLRMILMNAIVNAITFSEKKNKIGIHMELNQDGFIFKICNQGHPISEKDQKLIFDRFKKLDNSINSLNQGHGLGLSIVHDYVDLLNGKVSLKSTEEEGTIFTIKLPPLRDEENDFLMDEEGLFTTDDIELF